MIQAVQYLRPVPRVDSREWLPEHVTMPKGTETAGMPFSLAAFPHADGPLAAFDDPDIRTISLQWGSRLGKTTLCLSLMAKVAGTNPRNMMFASSTKDAAGRVVGSRLYPILSSTQGVRDELPSESRRSKLHVKLKACQVFVGWSGSETSLADVGAFFGTANEIDKWSGSASDEGDSLKLFVNRFKGFPDHKIIFESTPTIKRKSRIERMLQASNQHLRYVPCPHCGEYQVLRKGDEHTPGGFRWERDSQGNSDADIAFQTAYYECERCQGKIENHHRVEMLRAGLWVPEGCKIDKRGRIRGTAVKAGSDAVGFGPLASWYALTETWGSFARRWIQAKGRPKDLQDVVNSYMAETWEAKKSKSTPEKVGQRLKTTVPRGMVPEWGRFLTVTIDQQAAEGGYRLWVVLAHGIEGQCHVVDYGLALELDEIWNQQISQPWPHQDEGNPMQPTAAAADSGWDTKKTYDFCNAHPGMLACKGSGGDISGRPYRLSTVERGEHSGQLLFTVNTDFWETHLQACLDERLPGQPEALSLCQGAETDGEFLEQLCNGTLSDRVDRRGNPTMLWTKRHENIPNDFRDCVRYGMALGSAWVEENGGYPARSGIKTTKQTIVNPGDSRPDGRPWI